MTMHDGAPPSGQDEPASGGGPDRVVSEGAELKLTQTGPTRPDPDMRRQAAQQPAQQAAKVGGVRSGTRDLSHEPDERVTAAADKTGAGPNGGAAH